MLPWHSLAIVASCHQDACLPWTSSWWHAALWCYCGFQWLLSHRFLHQSSKTATYTWTGCPQHGSSVTKVWPLWSSLWVHEWWNMIPVHHTCNDILTTTPPRCTMRLLLVMLSAFWRFLCSWDGWDKAMHRSSRKFRNNPYNHGCRVTDMGDRYLQLQVEQEGFTQSTLKQPRICHFFGLTMLWSIGGSCGLVNNYMPLDVLLSCPRLGITSQLIEVTIRIAVVIVGLLCFSCWGCHTQTQLEFHKLATSQWPTPV